MKKMKIKHITIMFLMLASTLITSCQNQTNSNILKIDWSNTINGDFSFKDKWSYPEGIYKNEFGQLSCDGICPEKAHQMKDESGKIFKDSLHAFYKIVDTTHITYSLKSENKMYEFFKSNFITFTKQANGTILGESSTNTTTHSKLVVEIKNNTCNAWVNLNSSRGLGKKTFSLKKGTIKIDKPLFEKGIVKAKFNFDFNNTINSKKPLFWKGLIYSEIQN